MLALVGCGGAQAEKAEDVRPHVSEPPPTDAMPDVPNREVHIQDAELELERAERALDQGVAARRTTPLAPPQPQLPPPQPIPPTQPGTKPPTPSPSPPSPQAQSSCETACIALDSMKRSAKYLCELSGSRDARCASAEDRVRRAERRVREVCGVCGGEPAASLSPVRGESVAWIDANPLSAALHDP